uniref:Uncharacterized protein n=1 Tax=Odontella aurita TaxID=265563 RepID=A0A7S4IVP0_9STRA|mmetsp:Transcript_31089/g.93237  ORF Transcript_31089/g.93237 Transcript_31089/m.93237 type:complete len:372 (+) Transcript_31089:767-1882(+)
MLPSTWHNFFAAESTTGASFIIAAQEIVDEFGQKPLSDLRYIGVGENVLWDTPYTFVDGQSQIPDITIKSAYGVTKTSNEKTSNVETSISKQSLPWVAIAVAFSFVAVAVIVGTLIFVGRSTRNREVSKQKVFEEIAQNDRVATLQAVASPISVSVDEGEQGSCSDQSSRDDSSASTTSTSKRSKGSHSTQQKKQIPSEVTQGHFVQLFEATQHGSIENSFTYIDQQEHNLPHTNHETQQEGTSAPATNHSNHEKTLSNTPENSLNKDSLDHPKIQEETKSENKAQSSLEQLASKKPSVSWTGTLATFLTNAAAGLQGPGVSLVEQDSLDHERLQDQKQEDYAYFSVEQPKSPRRVRSENLYVIPEDDASL